MSKKAQAAAASKGRIRLRRDLFHPRAVQSNAGGVLANGPFRVKVEVFGSDLVYQEGERKLTLPVEFGWGGSCRVETGSIQRWDGTAEIFRNEQRSTIKKNIFAALNHLRIRYLSPKSGVTRNQGSGLLPRNIRTTATPMATTRRT